MAGIDGFPGFIKDIVQGSTRDFVIEMAREIKDAEGNVTGEEPVDLTDSKFFVTFAYDRDPATAPALEITIDPPTDPLDGKTLGAVEDEQSATLNVGRIYYSVRWVNDAGRAYVIDMAKIKILAAISSRRD